MFDVDVEITENSKVTYKVNAMAVDFCDYFWGEKHDGFHVLYHNLKSGFMATKDLADVVRETALIQENSYKVRTGN